MRHRPGITWLEIVVVLVLCFFVVGIGIVLIARHRENAQREQCKNNLRHLGLAFRAYHDTSSADKGLMRLPPSRIAEGYATWAVLLPLPHLLKEHPLQQWDLRAFYYLAAKAQEVREKHASSCISVRFAPGPTRSASLATSIRPTSISLKRPRRLRLGCRRQRARLDGRQGECRRRLLPRLPSAPTNVLSSGTA